MLALLAAIMAAGVIGPLVAALAAVVPAVWLVRLGVISAGERRTVESVLIVGTGQIASRLTELSRSGQPRRVHVVGCLGDEPLELDAGDPPPLLGGPDDLGRVLSEQAVDRVIVSFLRGGDESLVPLLRECDARGVAISIVPRFFELVSFDGHAPGFGGVPLVSLGRRRPRIPQSTLKRAIDVVGSTLALASLSPLLALIAVAIVADSGRPVLYRSRRIGRDGRGFAMLKFRTMVPDADTGQVERARALIGGQLKPFDDHRITRIGAVLRPASLDELPQLLNVLAGRMSLVGPRPILVCEAPGVKGWQETRHDVRPGMTGPWQVRGRSGLPWDERMQMEWSYARHWSIASDLRILLRTLPAVLSRRGAA